MLKYLFTILSAILLLTCSAYAASDATPAQKLEFKNQAVKWMVAGDQCGFEIKQDQLNVYIVKLIGELKPTLMNDMKSEAEQSGKKLMALSKTEKTKMCDIIYVEAEPFDIFK